MAWLHDWMDLADSTLKTLQRRDMEQLYSQEWPDTVRTLTSDHRASIEGERRRSVRIIRTASAVLYGLARRLAPQRRLLFVLAEIIALISTVRLFAHWNGDESSYIYALGGSILAIFLLTFLLGAELVDKIRFRSELELARDLQADLIPKELPTIAGLQLHAFNRIANTVGGDLYDFVSLGNGRTAAIFGDASGHGMAAGLVMAVAHASFRTQLDIDPSPESMIRTLNRILCRTGGKRSFFTCCYLLIEPNGSFEAIVAGHPPILQLSPGGEVVRRIGRGSYPLGIRANLSWSRESGTLEPGQTLFLFSDGIVEACDTGQGAFGYDRVERILGRCGRASLPDLVNSLLADWNSFMDGRPAEDDVTIAAMRNVS